MVPNAYMPYTEVLIVVLALTCFGCHGLHKNAEYMSEESVLHAQTVCMPKRMLALLTLPQFEWDSMHGKAWACICVHLQASSTPNSHNTVLCSSLKDLVKACPAWHSPYSRAKQAQHTFINVARQSS